MSKFKNVVVTKTKYILVVWLVAIIFAICVHKMNANDYLIGFSTGLVGSVSCILVMQIGYLIWIRKSDIKLKKETIKYKDERNIMIGEKANATSFIVMMLVLALSVTVLAFIDQDLSFKFSLLLWMGIITKLGTYFYYKKKL